MTSIWGSYQYHIKFTFSNIVLSIKEDKQVQHNKPSATLQINQNARIYQKQ